MVKTGGVAVAAPFLCPAPDPASDSEIVEEPVACEPNDDLGVGGDDAGRDKPEAPSEPADLEGMLPRILALLNIQLSDAEEQRRRCEDIPTPSETKAGVDLVGQIMRHLEKSDEMLRTARAEKERDGDAGRTGADEVERTAERVAARIEELVEARARRIAAERDHGTGDAAAPLGEAGTEP